MRTRKDIKGFVAKSTIISVLALSVGTGSAFADEAELQTTVSVDQAATISVQDNQSLNEQEAPALVPGDFFYFVKTIYERIQLSLASNDMEEAILLAKFAQERLAESAVLLAEGKAEEAEEALQLSLAQQQQAIDTAANVTDSTAPTSPAASTSEDKAQQSADAPAASASENTTVTDTAAENTTVAVTDSDDGTVEDEKVDVEPAQADQLKGSLKHNIVALAAALDKVKNPQAKQSLLKNITKSFAHLEKKLTKFNGETEAQVAASEEAGSASTTEDSLETTASSDVKAEASQSEVINASPATQVTEVDKKASESNKSAKANKQNSNKAKEKQSEKNNNKSNHSNPNAGKGKSEGQGHNKEGK
ncbi:hypothetical protein D3P08_20665 [Paenibacillus nanensis]|uniref:DUF5667 domain-containing protein n=1 Tax=Paenibacillus nanensis TaxID=393251 RepID=A0A3A1UNY1_9BACL|nr:DUF5667 domain-containing protein [Paenibacillus nanensis]RIX50267.1 hypothetical protein D3P08_20665 [Paenibacillus nanensis]